MALQEIKVPFHATFNFGVGVDSISMSSMGMAVQGPTTALKDADAAIVGFSIERIKSTHELETHLDLQVNASYGSVAFGAGVADRFAFAAASKIQTSSLCLSIVSKVTLPPLSIADPSLTENAAKMIDNPTTFSARFGDLFVRAIGRGGLFVAVLKIDTSDESSAEEISNRLCGSYGMFSGDASTKFSSIQHDFHSEISIMVYHEGGPVNLFPDNIEDPVLLIKLLQTWLKSFADDPARAAVPYFAMLAPIAIANGPLPLNAAESEHAQDVLVNCAKLRSSTIDNLNLMDAIIQKPQRFTFTPPITIADIKAASNGFQADLELIADAASAAMDHPATAMMPAAFAVAKNLGSFPKGFIPMPMPMLDMGPIALMADRGRRIAKQDELLTALRELEPEGPSRLGFDIGLAIDETGTAQGPGKEKFKNDHLHDFDPGAYQRAVDFTMDKNRFHSLAIQGVHVLEVNPAAKAARTALPLGNGWLGFNIAAGQFGSVADGGSGDVDKAGGSQTMRDSLSRSVQFGFDTAVAFFKPR